MNEAEERAAAMAFQKMVRNQLMADNEKWLKENGIAGLVVCAFKENAQGDVMQALVVWSAAPGGTPLMLAMAAQGVDSAITQIKASQQPQLIVPNANSNKLN